MWDTPLPGEKDYLVNGIIGLLIGGLAYMGAAGVYMGANLATSDVRQKHAYFNRPELAGKDVKISKGLFDDRTIRVGEFANDDITTGFTTEIYLRDYALFGHYANNADAEGLRDISADSLEAVVQNLSESAPDTAYDGLFH